MKLFIHRSGRTARNGQKGISFSIITKEELPYLHDLSVFVGRKYYDQVPADSKETIEEILADPGKVLHSLLTHSRFVMVACPNPQLMNSPTNTQPCISSTALSWTPSRNPSPSPWTSTIRTRTPLPWVQSRQLKPWALWSTPCWVQQ